MENGSSIKVLLVDTRPESLFSIANELNELGLQVVAASGVDQAMTIAERTAFAIVVCCQPLDFGDAHLLLRFLRRAKRHRRLRLVITDTCQKVGVRLTNAGGEPIYSISDNLPAKVVDSIIRQTIAMPFLEIAASRRTSNAVNIAPPHHFPNDIFSALPRNEWVKWR
jgi:CheY-like chemotaxis protein